jgi:signal transduction histidine kinase
LALLYNLASFVEILRVLAIAVYRRKPHSWIIAAGVAAFIIAAGFQIIAALINPGGGQNDFIYLYGMMVMLVFMSISLARWHARVNTNLERELVHVSDLSAQALESERRVKEIEMARMKLEADNALKEIELEEAHKRQKVLDALEATNRELRDTQAQLVQSEKMASLGNLVAGVAHEINTPVGAISSMHNTLVRALAKLKATLQEIAPEELERNRGLQNSIRAIEDANSVIDSGSCRVTNIVKRLRSFARLDEAELKDADIHEGLEDTLTLVHHELKRDITVEKNYGKIPVIACYPGQLNQVFLNMLVNARQAIDGKGTIRISTYSKNDQVYIGFEDTGRGIPKEQLSQIFDPGFTTKGVGVGTGLGLSICYRIIQAHRGEINVYSVVGKGTTFTVVLPTNLEAQEGAETRNREESERA